MRKEKVVILLFVVCRCAYSTEYTQLTNIPTVYIDTDSGKDPEDKTHQIACNITIVSEGNILQQRGVVRLRGNGTLKVPKKSYRIKFNNKQTILDAPAKAKKWTLLANYGDKSLMRNAVAFYVARQLDMEYVPYLYPVDVVMNGEYKGNYQLCDQIEVRKGRVDINKIEDDAVAGGFLIEIDAYAVKDPHNEWFYSNENIPVSFKDPDADEIGTEQYRYIQRQFNKAMEKWKERLDITSFLQHFLVGEFTGNKDTYWSVYMYQKNSENQMLYTGPVWDFDLSMDNSKWIFPVNWQDSWVYEIRWAAHAGDMHKKVSEIIKDKDVNIELKKMWAEARQKGLCEDSIIAFIDEYEELVRESANLNFQQWDILSHTVYENPRAYMTYENEVEAVRIFVRERIRWMDDKLHYTPPSSDSSYKDQQHINFNESYQIYTIMGCLLVTELEHLPTGVYLFRQGMQTVKIFIP